MANITMNISKSTVTASAHLPYGAYKRAEELALAYEGKIGRTAENHFTATFDKVKTAKKFKSEWEADYAKAHAAYTPKPTEPKALKSTKKSKPSSSKKGNAKKMTLDEFIKANPLCTREEAKAHGFKGTRAELRAHKKELGLH